MYITGAALDRPALHNIFNTRQDKYDYTGDLVEHAWHFFRKAVYSRYNVSSKIF
jgi:hypothetical protein